MSRVAITVFSVCALAYSHGAFAQNDEQMHEQMHHGAQTEKKQSEPHQHQPATPAKTQEAHSGMSMEGEHAGHEMMMSGVLGGYSMMRDSSGTSCQPESTPMHGLQGMLGDWSTMLHGWINLVYDHQAGPRGDTKTFSQSMFMGMMQRLIGQDTLTLRGMISLDPTMGRSGYPLLFQTGETANGVDPLIDRQHPHDFLMELAGIYSMPFGEGSAFIYAGYPGEPALGPPTYVHRFSGMDNPEAPLGHHWMDSTHISFGVLTFGYVWGEWKIEASAFNGREPDENRWNFDSPRLDSASARLTWNPTENWSLQVSWGYLHSPEQLEPEVQVRRTTASISYNYPFPNGNWQTTFVWGQNDSSPGETTDAFLLETAAQWDRHTIFARGEVVDKNELFIAPEPLAGRTFKISKLSVGYVYDLPVAEHVAFGIGALGSLYDFSDTLDSSYGNNPASYMLFARLKLH